MCECNTYFLARWFQNLSSFEIREISKPLHIIWSIWTLEYSPTLLENFLLMVGPMSSLAVIRQSATIQTSLVGIMTMQYLKHEIQATHYTTPERSVTLQLSTYFMSKSRTANSICFAILYLHYCYRSTVPDASFSCNYRQFRILTRILRMQPSCSTNVD